MRSAVLLFVMAILLSACDPPKDGNGDTASASSARPPIQVVVRAVELQMTISRRAQAGETEEQKWDAIDGKMWVVVTVDIAHNQCSAGDKIDSKDASLTLSGGETAKVEGGGVTVDKLCVLCQATEPVKCNGGMAPLTPYTFVFSAPHKADLSEAKLGYKGQQADLSVVKIRDKLGNAELAAKIKEKEAQIAKLRKKLENTGSIPAGKIILGEIDEIKREIKELKKKQQ